MTGLDKIVDKIIGDAKEYAQNQKLEADAKAGDIIAEEEDRASEFKKRISKEAKADGEIILQRASSVSQMEKRDVLLGAKRELLDMAYAEAVKVLQNADKDTYIAFLKKQLESAISEMPDADYEIFSNEKDKDTICQLLTNYNNIKFAGTRAIDGGFILKRRGVELNCSLSSCVYSLRNESEDEIRKMLF